MTHRPDVMAPPLYLPWIPESATAAPAASCIGLVSSRFPSDGLTSSHLPRAPSLPLLSLFPCDLLDSPLLLLPPPYLCCLLTFSCGVHLLSTRIAIRLILPSSSGVPEERELPLVASRFSLKSSPQLPVALFRRLKLLVKTYKQNG